MGKVITFLGKKQVKIHRLKGCTNGEFSLFLQSIIRTMEWTQMYIKSLGEMSARSYVLLLKETEGARQVPIVIGEREAMAYNIATMGGSSSANRLSIMYCSTL